MTHIDDLEARYDEAAQLVRHILETAVAPRVSYMLEQTVKGQPLNACMHLVEDTGPALSSATIDWMCEGVGLQCWKCTIRHMTDPRTPHRDPRHEVCIVCGYRSGNDLNPYASEVKLGQPLMISSPALTVLSDLTGTCTALGYSGHLVATPTAWECPAHDGFLDSDLTLHWPKVTRRGEK